MIASSGAIAAAVHQRAGRVDGHTRVRGKFLGTMIRYASSVVAQPLALALAHVLVHQVLPLGLAHLTVATDLLAIIPAVHLPVVAAWADVEHPQANPAALLAKRLHRSTRPPTKTCPDRATRRRCSQAQAPHSIARVGPRLRVMTSGPQSCAERESGRVHPTCAPHQFSAPPLPIHPRNG